MPDNVEAVRHPAFDRDDVLRNAVDHAYVSAHLQRHNLRVEGQRARFQGAGFGLSAPGKVQGLGFKL